MVAAPAVCDLFGSCFSFFQMHAIDVTRQPLRLWHQPPNHIDCGVVLCPSCFQHWRRMPQARCPKCRADIVCLGISADGPVVGGGGQPDPLLMRLVKEILPSNGEDTKWPAPPPPLPGPPASITHRQPVRIEDMQIVLRHIVAHLDSIAFRAFAEKGGMPPRFLLGEQNHGPCHSVGAKCGRMLLSPPQL